MPITVQTVTTSSSLQDIERVINQTERLGWMFVSLAAGTVGGSPANLVVFATSAGAAPNAVSLVDINGAEPLAQQEAILNRAGKQILSYGEVYISGGLRNVAVLR